MFRRVTVQSRHELGSHLATQLSPGLRFGEWLPSLLPSSNEVLSRAGLGAAASPYALHSLCTALGRKARKGRTFCSDARGLQASCRD